MLQPVEVFIWSSQSGFYCLLFEKTRLKKTGDFCLQTAFRLRQLFNQNRVNRIFRKVSRGQNFSIKRCVLENIEATPPPMIVLFISPVSFE